jgi:hypothetical protein
MREVKNSTKKKRVSGYLKKGVVTSDPNEIVPAITPEESQRRAHLTEIFEQIEAGRLRTKKLPKGVTIDSLIEEGRK